MKLYICDKVNLEQTACKACEHAEPHELHIDGGRPCTEPNICHLDLGTAQTVRCVEYNEG